MKNPYPYLINHFWTLRSEENFSHLQTDLYFALLQNCNRLYWKNPFNLSNMSLMAQIGVSEQHLIAAKNRLKQAGLIDFVSGKKGKLSEYTIIHLLNVSQDNSQIDSEFGIDFHKVSHNNSLDSSLSSSLDNNLDVKKGEAYKKTEKQNNKPSTKTNTEYVNEQGRDFIEKNKNAEEQANKKEKKVAQKKEKENHLFRESEFFDFEKFSKAYLGTAFENCDLKFYYESILSWSDNGNERSNWIAIGKTFMLRNKAEGKLQLKENIEILNSKHNGKETKNGYEQRQAERLERIRQRKGFDESNQE